MWAKWTAFYNRAKSANAAFSLADRAWQVFSLVTGLSGAAVLAWMSTTWQWYWSTFSWAGVAFAFLVSCVGLSLTSFLSGVAAYLWRNRALYPNAQGHKIPEDESKTYVREIHIAVGPPPSTEPVMLIGYATRNEVRLRIVVEYSYLVIAVGFVAWQARTLVEIDDLRDIITGQKIIVPIVTASIHDKTAKLMWGKSNGQLVNSIRKGKYRARIRLIGIVSEQAPKYFLLTAFADSDPNLIGITMDNDFAFISEWEK